MKGCFIVGVHHSILNNGVKIELLVIGWDSVLLCLCVDKNTYSEYECMFTSLHFLG